MEEMRDNVYKVALAVCDAAWDVRRNLAVAPCVRGGPYVYRVAPTLWLVVGAGGLRLVGKDWHRERIAACTMAARLTSDLKTRGEIVFFLSRANRLVSTLRRLNQQLAAQRALAMELLSPLAAQVAEQVNEA